MEPIRNETCPKLELLIYKKGCSSYWQRPRQIQTIHTMDTANSFLALEFDICVIMAPVGQFRQCELCREQFSRIFATPRLLEEDYFWNLNGCFGSENTTDDQGVITSYSSWMRAQVKHFLSEGSAAPYVWYELSVFTRWLASTKQTILLVFDTSAEIATRIPGLLLQELDTKELAEPFWIYPRLLEEIVRLQNRAVWAIRDQVRITETHRTSPSQPQPNYPYLHDIARHAIHVSETLDVAIKTTSSILMQHNQFAANNAVSDAETAWATTRVRQRLLSCEHLFYSLRCRSVANKERLTNETGLAFNTVAQYDSRISVKIGRATQSDSETMKSIAVLTLTFLPATFLSAIFSTSFFNFNADTGRWAVSDKFWVYWAVTIPATVLTYILWYYGKQIFLRRPAGEKSEVSSNKSSASLTKNFYKRGSDDEHV